MRTLVLLAAFFTVALGHPPTFPMEFQPLQPLPSMPLHTLPPIHAMPMPNIFAVPQPQAPSSGSYTAPASTAAASASSASSAGASGNPVPIPPPAQASQVPTGPAPPSNPYALPPLPQSFAPIQLGRPASFEYCGTFSEFECKLWQPIDATCRWCDNSRRCAPHCSH